jgi:3-dehydroquinate dehydratase/shikimate dehydrogenase
MERLGPVVATAAAPTVREAARASRLARERGADRVEVRLDLLAPGEDPGGLLQLAREMPLLVSSRRDRLFPDEIPLLRSAQGLGAWIDLPDSEDLPEDLFGLERGRMVLSWHDFGGTPDGIEGIPSRLRARRAAAYKMVPTARDLPDALSLLKVLEREGGRNDLAGFAMGAPGLPTRALSLAWGSCATYAAAPGCDAAAPGQPSLEDLLVAFRPGTLRREEPLYALVGWPLLHTRTPLFFNPWLERAGLPGRYIPFPCTEPRDLLESGLPLRGVAVTMPHKEAPLRLTSRVSRLALACGACNTLVRAGLGWLAANTDVHGVRRALHSVPKGTEFLLLGCGGAAAAAAVALRGRGPGRVAGRDLAKTRRFASRFGLEAVPWESAPQWGWSLLVNATPVGWEGESTPYPADGLKGRWVMDMVVRPGGTPLLRAAAGQGLEAIPGEAMLVPQAALQFRLWTGRRPP